MDMSINIFLYTIMCHKIVIIRGVVLSRMDIFHFFYVMFPFNFFY